MKPTYFKKLLAVLIAMSILMPITSALALNTACNIPLRPAGTIETDTSQNPKDIPPLEGYDMIAHFNEQGGDDNCYSQWLYFDGDDPTNIEYIDPVSDDSLWFYGATIVDGTTYLISTLVDHSTGLYILEDAFSHTFVGEIWCEGFPSVSLYSMTYAEDTQTVYVYGDAHSGELGGTWFIGELNMETREITRLCNYSPDTDLMDTWYVCMTYIGDGRFAAIEAWTNSLVIVDLDSPYEYEYICTLPQYASLMAIYGSVEQFLPQSLYYDEADDTILWCSGNTHDYMTYLIKIQLSACELIYEVDWQAEGMPNEGGYTAGRFIPVTCFLPVPVVEPAPTPTSVITESPEPTTTVEPTPTAPAVSLSEAMNIEGGTLEFTSIGQGRWQPVEYIDSTGRERLVGQNDNISPDSTLDRSSVYCVVEMEAGEALYFDWAQWSSDGIGEQLEFFVNAVRHDILWNEADDFNQYCYVALTAGTYRFSWSATRILGYSTTELYAMVDDVYIGEPPYGEVNVSGVTLGGVAIGTDSLLNFEANAPDAAQILAECGVDYYAAEVVDDYMYGYDSNGYLWRTNMNSFESEQIGHMGSDTGVGVLMGIEEMSYDRDADTMYAVAVSLQGSLGFKGLATVNLQTGIIDWLFMLNGIYAQPMGLACLGNGYFVTCDAHTNKLIAFDMHTQNSQGDIFTDVTWLPLDIGYYYQSMTYNYDDDLVYIAAVSESGTRELLVVDMTTGACTNTGSIAGNLNTGGVQLIGLHVVPEEESPYEMGDVNMDGVVNTGDAAYILRYCVGLLTMDEEQLRLADVNDDGEVNTGDAAMLLKLTIRRL